MAYSQNQLYAGRVDTRSSKIDQEGNILKQGVQMKKMKPDSILSSCGFKVIGNKLDLLRFPEVAKNRLFLDPFQRFIAYAVTTL